nr:hypothetical protein [Kamptonema formosum]
MISDSDFFICEAFSQILASPPAELAEKFGSETPLAIANYLQNIPPAEQLDSAAMANYITAFCQKPGNENLNERLGEIYDSLDEDGIDKLVKKTGDPDDIATAISQNPRQRINESRDICQSLQSWANNVRNQTNQRNQNATNSN